MYHFNLVPRMGPAEGLSLYHQAPNLVQIRENKIHNVVMLNNYIYIKMCQDFLSFRNKSIHSPYLAILI